MSALRPGFVWALVFVAAAAGGIYLADRLVLEREGQIPQSYAAERAPTAFERELWARFWELANDPGEAKKRGVRALHGEAVSTRLRKDRVYSITLRSTGELTIQPIR